MTCEFKGLRISTELWLLRNWEILIQISPLLETFCRKCHDLRKYYRKYCTFDISRSHIFCNFKLHKSHYKCTKIISLIIIFEIYTEYIPIYNNKPELILKISKPLLSKSIVVFYPEMFSHYAEDTFLFENIIHYRIT